MLRLGHLEGDVFKQKLIRLERWTGSLWHPFPEQVISGTEGVPIIRAHRYVCDTSALIPVLRNVKYGFDARRRPEYEPDRRKSPDRRLLYYLIF